MIFLKQKIILNPLKNLLVLIIFLNIYIFYKMGISQFDQILNIIISFGVFNLHSENSFKKKNVFE